MGRNVYISEKEFKVIQKLLGDLEEQVGAGGSEEHEEDIRVDILHLKNLIKKYGTPQTGKYTGRDRTFSDLIMSFKRDRKRR